jgi:ketosteroid isomerase-like protein
MRVTSPSQFPSAFAAAFSSGETTAVMALYCADAVLVSPTGEELRGTEAIANYLQWHLARKLTMRISPHNLVIQSDIALLNNRFEVLDGHSVLFSGDSMEVLRRDVDGGWRLLIDQPNSKQMQALPQFG